MTGLISSPVLASTIGKIFQPLYEALAWILAFFYALIPNYAVAIALLTLAVMVVTSPFTVKSTRSQLAMQKLAPELKKIQQKYKGDRVTLNEQMMALYKEHGVNPASGCVPLLLQLPVFVVLYGVIRGLTHTVKDKAGQVIADPDYISHHTRLYRDLIAAKGHMDAFGLDLTKTPFSHEAHWYVAIPYVAIVLVAIALQYLQMRQLNRRNPSLAQANPQMQMMQRYMPLIFAFIYIRISAGVNIYFVVSSLCRIGIQEAIFRSGMLDRAPAGKRAMPPGGGRKRGVMERLADAQQRAIEQQKARQASLLPPVDDPPEDASGTAGPRPPGGSNRPRATNARSPEGKQAAAPGKQGSQQGKQDQARPNGPSTAGNGKQSQKPSGGQNGSRKAGSGASANGGPAPNGPSKPAPPPGPRAAKKRPRKAR